MSLDEYYAKIEARKTAAKNTRMAGKRQWQPEIRRLLTELRRIIPNCGLTEKQMSECSGVVRSSLRRVMNSRFDSARFDTIVQIIGAAGYRFEIVELDPRKDPNRSMRRLAPPPLDE